MQNILGKLRHYLSFFPWAPQLLLLPKLLPPQLQKLLLQLHHHLLLHLHLQPPVPCLQHPKCHRRLSKPNLVRFLSSTFCCGQQELFLSIMLFLGHQYCFSISLTVFPSVSSSCCEACSSRTRSFHNWRQRRKQGNSYITLLCFVPAFVFLL